MTRTLLISLAAAGVVVMAVGALAISQVSPAGAQNQATDRSFGEGEARGVVRAPMELSIASVDPARIAELPLGEGLKFAKGTVLVRFDCTRLEAERDAARAAVAAKKIAFETQELLLKRRASGELDVKSAKIGLSQAEAELRGYEARVGTCQITAPFDGMVATKKAEVGMVANPGAPILEVFETSHYEVMLVVPSRWLANLRPGLPFRFAVDETGDFLRGTVLRIAPVVDPVAQTARVIGRLEDPGNRLMPGMSGSARFAAAGG